MLTQGLRIQNYSRVVDLLHTPKIMLLGPFSWFRPRFGSQRGIPLLLHIFYWLSIWKFKLSLGRHTAHSDVSAFSRLLGSVLFKRVFNRYCRSWLGESLTEILDSLVDWIHWAIWNFEWVWVLEYLVRGLNMLVLSDRRDVVIEGVSLLSLIVGG